MAKKYLKRRGLPIFVADIEVVQKFVLPEYAEDDERFLRRLARSSQVEYGIDVLDYRLDVVEIPRSRRHPPQAISAPILAQLLGFAPRVDPAKLPVLPTVGEAEAMLAGVRESENITFRKKTPAQIIAEVKEKRKMAARDVGKGDLLNLDVWLQLHFDYKTTIRY